jgi:hypothetical protein
LELRLSAKERNLYTELGKWLACQLIYNFESKRHEDIVLVNDPKTRGYKYQHLLVNYSTKGN